MELVPQDKVKSDTCNFTLLAGLYHQVTAFNLFSPSLEVKAARDHMTNVTKLVQHATWLKFRCITGNDFIESVSLIVYISMTAVLLMT